MPIGIKRQIRHPAGRGQGFRRAGMNLIIEIEAFGMIDGYLHAFFHPFS